jgi:hypothetical protein
MLHMNKTARYQNIYDQLRMIADCSGGRPANYIAGLLMGQQIQKGLDAVELDCLRKLTNELRYVK